MKIVILITILCISTDTVVAQDFSKVKNWLAGTWEGTGFVAKSERPQKFTFTYQLTSSSLQLKCDIGIIFNEKLDILSEYTHVDRNQEEITVYFLGDGSNADNRELKVSRIGEEHINISLIFNRYNLKQKLIAHGAFKKVKP